MGHALLSAVDMLTDHFFPGSVSCSAMGGKDMKKLRFLINIKFEVIRHMHKRHAGEKLVDFEDRILTESFPNYRSLCLKCNRKECPLHMGPKKAVKKSYNKTRDGTSTKIKSSLLEQDASTNSHLADNVLTRFFARCKRRCMRETKRFRSSTSSRQAQVRLLNSSVSNLYTIDDSSFRVTSQQYKAKQYLRETPEIEALRELAEMRELMRRGEGSDGTSSTTGAESSASVENVDIRALEREVEAEYQQQLEREIAFIENENDGFFDGDSSTSEGSSSGEEETKGRD